MYNIMLILQMLMSAWISRYVGEGHVLMNQEVTDVYVQVV